MERKTLISLGFKEDSNISNIYKPTAYTYTSANGAAIMVDIKTGNAILQRIIIPNELVETFNTKFPNREDVDAFFQNLDSQVFDGEISEVIKAIEAIK